jgi:hypothetical protein
MTTATERRTLAWLAALAALAAPPALAQLDETWTVSSGGQSAPVDAGGHFRIANVSAPDRFGPGGPGSPPDGEGDSFQRVRGVSHAGGITRHAYSERFRIRQGEAADVGELVVSPYPLPAPGSIAIEAPRSGLDVGETVQLAVRGVSFDESVRDVTSQADGTVYATSNPAVATVSADGLVTARCRGAAFVSAVNEGATAATRFVVSAEVRRLAIEGFAFLPDGSPAAGASVAGPGVASTEVGADGSFSLSVDAAIGSSVTLLFTVTSGGAAFRASITVRIPAEGIADAGRVELAPVIEGALYLGEKFRLQSSPRDLLVADLNGDGRPDVVTPDVGLGNESFGTLSVLLGAGGLRFAPARSLAVGGRPVAVASADFDRDGRLDLAAAGTERISVFLGQADGELRAAPDLDGFFFPTDLEAGDLNGDSNADLVCADQDSANSTAIYLGRGDGTFLPPAFGSPGASSLVLADLDGDRDLDLVLAKENDVPDLVLLLGNGDGTFEAPRRTPLAGDPDQVRVRKLLAADLNGDGLPELVVLTNPASVVIFANRGSGDFAVSARLTGGGALLGGAAFGDLNQDGITDLVVSAVQFSTVISFLGQGEHEGNLEFRRQSDVDVGFGPSALALRDLDADGSLDLLVVYGTSLDGGLSVLAGRGDGDFDGSPPSFGIGETPGRLLAANLDLADDRPDLINALPNGGFVHLNQPDGTFQNPTSLVESGGITAAAWALLDANGDGIPDVAAAGGAQFGLPSSLAVSLGNGEGTFQAPAVQALEPNLVPAWVEPGRFNGDAFEDLVVTSRRGDHQVLLGQGDGTFQAAAPLAVEEGTQRQDVPVTRVMDLNADGFLDLATPIINPQIRREVRVALGQGDGTLVPGPSRALFEDPRSTNRLTASIALADLDGDGRPDLLALLAFTTDGLPHSDLQRFAGRGDGSFGEAERTVLNTEFTIKGQIEAADVDQDGILDVVVAADLRGSGGDLTVLRGSGDGSFAAPVSFFSKQRLTSLAVADFNVDGLLDLAVVGNGPEEGQPGTVTRLVLYLHR